VCVKANNVIFFNVITRSLAAGQTHNQTSETHYLLIK